MSMPCFLPIKAAANILKVIGDVAVPSQQVKSVKKRARLPLGSGSNIKLCIQTANSAEFNGSSSEWPNPLTEKPVMTLTASLFLPKNGTTTVRSRRYMHPDWSKCKPASSPWLHNWHQWVFFPQED